MWESIYPHCYATPLTRKTQSAGPEKPERGLATESETVPLCPSQLLPLCLQPPSLWGNSTGKSPTLPTYMWTTLISRRRNICIGKCQTARHDFGPPHGDGGPVVTVQNRPGLLAGRGEVVLEKHATEEEYEERLFNVVTVRKSVTTQPRSSPPRQRLHFACTFIQHIRP